MATNDFKPFATGSNANVMDQDAWESLPALTDGFTSGKASSAQVKKALRQTSFITSALAQFVADNTGSDVKDDGNSNGFQQQLSDALGGNDKYLTRDTNLSDIKDKNIARESLELKSGATHDVQESGIDITNQALLTVGGFGLGTPIVIKNIKPYSTFEEWADMVDSGVYYFPNKAPNLIDKYVVLFRDPHKEKTCFTISIDPVRVGTRLTISSAVIISTGGFAK